MKKVLIIFVILAVTSLTGCMELDEPESSEQMVQQAYVIAENGDEFEVIAEFDSGVSLADVEIVLQNVQVIVGIADVTQADSIATQGTMDVATTVPQANPEWQQVEGVSITVRPVGDILIPEDAIWQWINVGEIWGNCPPGHGG